MTGFSSSAEIKLDEAKDRIANGSKLIWVLGPLDERRLVTLQETVAALVYSVDAEEIYRSKKPETLVGKSPVLVCEHGITSLFIANHLRKEGIEAFSIEGGVDDMLKW